MGTNPKSMSKPEPESIKVFVNPGPKMISVAGRSGDQLEKPTFIKVANGVRDQLAIWCGKVLTDDNGSPILNEEGSEQPDYSKKATVYLEWEFDPNMVVDRMAEEGELAGQMVSDIVIQNEFITEWLNQLVFIERGAVRPDVAQTLKAFKPTIIGATSSKKDNDLENF